MTFEEWFDKLDEYEVDPYRESDKWHNQDILRLAWEAGYEQGFQIGVDEGYGTGLYDGRQTL
jgi:flagellar biosynthesis/type III secretory pathway protein FliH